MKNAQSAPLIVSGPGRSGTTFMQFLLSRHPRMQVFGQPVLSLADWACILQRIDSADATASDWNQKPWVKDYAEPHYAGGVQGAYDDKLAALIQAHYTGTRNQDKQEWGLKSIWSSASQIERAFVERVWKGRARWLVCIREPFATLADVRSTFAPQMTIPAFMEHWLASVDFARKHAAPIVQLDLLDRADTQERVARLESVMEAVGLPVWMECRSFIQSWPRIHETVQGAAPAAIEEADRKLALAEIPSLAATMESLGYGS